MSGSPHGVRGAFQFGFFALAVVVSAGTERSSEGVMPRPPRPPPRPAPPPAGGACAPAGAGAAVVDAGACPLAGACAPAATKPIEKSTAAHGPVTRKDALTIRCMMVVDSCTRERTWGPASAGPSR